MRSRTESSGAEDLLGQFCSSAGVEVELRVGHLCYRILIVSLQTQATGAVTDIAAVAALSNQRGTGDDKPCPVEDTPKPPQKQTLLVC